MAALAPSGVTVACRVATLAELAQLAPITAGTPPVPFATVAAAEGDSLHDAALPSVVLHWRDLLASEERRVVAGSPLSAQRFAIVAPSLSTYTERPRLEAIWREERGDRPVLVRALDAAAWAPDQALGEVGAALLLCAAGRAAPVRLLPFAGAPQAARDAAITAWRDGDHAPWTTLGLEALAERARAMRRALERLLHALPDEAARLDRLGRAAITARRALALVRETAVTTMPLLADSLAVSRPAAGDALERLLAAGLVRELTGRARDRVYAWDAACMVVPAARPPSPAAPGPT